MNIRIILLFLLTIWFGQSCTSETQSRVTQKINNNWVFQYSPKSEINNEFLVEDFDDVKWSIVSLPHTWQTFETTTDEHPYNKSAAERDDPYWWKGWGYYRKTLNFNKFSDRLIQLEFDGVQKYSELYVNGDKVGYHKGGFTSFYFDITDYLKQGKNTIVVAVSNKRDDDFGGIAPMSAGNWNVYGGIYRGVRLVSKSKIHIPFQGSYKHEGGTFITTPKVSLEEANVQIKTWIKNEYKKEKEVQLISKIISPEGEEIQQLKSKIKLPPGEITEIEQLSKNIISPKLWSPKDPNLYKVISIIQMDKKNIDIYESPLGFRWYSWDHDDNRMIFNGKKIHIHGTNRHQEYPWLGDAIPKWLIKRDFLDIKNNLGHNFIRTGHYPNDPYVYHLTDSLGIITVEEVPNIKPLDFSEEIQEINVKEMIRRDRNHPSICFWSMGNETHDAADSEWAWKEDKTRILHQRKSEEYGDYITHDHTDLDMENMLRVTIRGWYNKDVKNLEPKNTLKVPKSGQYAGTEEWQHKMARVKGGSIRGRVDESIVAWLYEDHGCDRIYRNAPLKYINYKGWVDSYRVPKYMYYLYQAHYAPYPMVHIAPHNWRKQYLGQNKSIQVDSNCDKIELFVNGKLIETGYPNAENFHTISFNNINIIKGEIKAVAYNGDKQVAVDKVVMAEEPHKLKVWVESDDFSANSSGLVLVWADIVDENGVHVYGATNELNWEISGEGKLVGPNKYETDIDKTSAGIGQGYIDAPAFNIVRSTNTLGEITVKVSSPGLKEAEISFESGKYEQCNNVAQEIILDYEGRNKVVKDETFKESFKLIEVIKRIDSNQNIPDDDKNGYANEIDQFILKRNPSVKVKSAEYKALLKSFGQYLNKMKGEVIADDYNFMINRFNACYSLNRVVKSKFFQKDYEKVLRKHYAKTIIEDGQTVDYEREANKILGVNRNMTVLLIQSPSENFPEGDLQIRRTTHITKVNAYSFKDAIYMVYPEYKNYSSDKWEKVTENLVDINPGLIKTKSGEIKFKDLTAIAIPELE